MEINTVLETAPGKIYEYASKENEQYALMIRYHESHKRLRARKYLTLRAEGKTIKDADSECDCDEEISVIKDKEMGAEIEYRNQRILKDRADDYLQCALEIGRTMRAEIRAGLDTVKE